MRGQATKHSNRPRSLRTFRARATALETVLFLMWPLSIGTMHLGAAGLMTESARWLISIDKHWLIGVYIFLFAGWPIVVSAWVIIRSAQHNRTRKRAQQADFWVCPCCMYQLTPSPDPTGEQAATCPECGFVVREHEREKWWTSALRFRWPFKRRSGTPNR